MASYIPAILIALFIVGMTLYILNDNKKDSHKKIK